MTISEKIKERIILAMKAKNEIEKNILRVALGDIQSFSSKNGSIAEENEIKIISSIIQKNKETMDLLHDKSNENTLTENLKEKAIVEKLSAENVILKDLLPEFMTEREILDFILSMKDKIENIKNVGQVIGLVIKSLKAENKVFNGSLVSSLVKHFIEGRIV